jgi:hypothetical protein
MLITAAEAAEILGMQLQSVYDAASRGRLTRHAPGHVRRAYDHTEIEALSLSRIRRQHHEPHHYWATSPGGRGRTSPLRTSPSAPTSTSGSKATPTS